MNTARKPKSSSGCLARMWVNDHYHVAFWFIVAFSGLALYVFVHMGGTHFREKYEEEARALIKEAVKLYQIRENPQTKLLEITVEGESLVLSAGKAGPLGVGKIASVRGLLAGAQADLNHYYEELASYISDLGIKFDPDGQLGGYQVAPLSFFLDQANNGEAVDDTRFVRVKAEPTFFRDLPANEVGRRKLRITLNSLEVVDPRKPSYVASMADLRMAANLGFVSPAVSKSIRKIVKDVESRVPKLAGTPDKSSEKVVIASVRDKLAPPPTPSFFRSTKEQESGFERNDRGGGDRNDQSNSSQREENDEFHESLANLTFSEIGFFWVLGKWCWIEVLLLTWLGVLTEQLTRLGLQYARRDPDGAVWEPRESGRTLLKLVYAPAVSMVVVWTIFFTDLLSFDTLIGEGTFTLFVPLAFVLGLFPNLGYSLLKRLAEAIFRKTSVAAKPQAPRRKATREPLTPPVSSGAPPNFEVVKASIRRHATAPLRG